MNNKHNLKIGDSYGEWVVLSDYFFKSNSCRSYKYLKLQCSCGKIKDVRVDGMGLMCHSCSTKQNNLNRRYHREYITDGDVTKIMYNGYCILVDTDMVKYIDNILWRIRDNNRVIGENEHGEIKLLYRYLFEVRGINIENKVIDHINRNPLDNRLSNLNIVTHAENSENKSINKRNKSGVAGVTWHKQRKKWRARINKQGKEYSLGLFESKQDAIEARKKAEKEIFKYKSSLQKGE